MTAVLNTLEPKISGMFSHNFPPFLFINTVREKAEQVYTEKERQWVQRLTPLSLY